MDQVGDVDYATAPKDMLDRIVVEQQDRIVKLEEEIRRAKRKIVKLRSENAKGSAPMRGFSREAEDGGPEKKQPRYWTQEEHRRYLVASAKHGEKNYVPIAKEVGTRSAKQVRTHHQKYLKRLERESRRRENSDIAIEDASSKVSDVVEGSPQLGMEPEMSLEPSLEPEPEPAAPALGKVPSVSNFLAELGAGTVVGASLNGLAETAPAKELMYGQKFVSCSSLSSSETDLELGDVEPEFFLDGLGKAEPSVEPFELPVGI